MRSSLYKMFTIDTTQDNAPDMSWFSMKSEKFLRIKPGTDFPVHSKTFLICALLRSLIYAPTFWQIKYFIKILSMARFISITIPVVKIKIFKVLRTNSASMKWPFLGFFLGPYSPKHGLILLKLSPEVVYKQEKKNS